MIRNYLPFVALRKARNLSERALALAVKLSRGAVRQLSGFGDGNLTLRSINEMAEFFSTDVEVILTQKNIFSEFSTVAVAYKIERDGFDSWKIHFFDFIDEYRRTLDSRLIVLPPHEGFDQRLTALLAAIVRDLTEQIEITTPSWAAKRLYLATPWFVSEMQSLKASAILESPLPYRANNIFVHDNFLSRV